METILKLNEQDIRDCIAKHFGARPEDVTVDAARTYDGYGPTEHEVYRATATVTMKGDKKHVTE